MRMTIIVERDHLGLKRLEGRLLLLRLRVVPVCLFSIESRSRS